jgi:hypothetical protein
MHRCHAPFQQARFGGLFLWLPEKRERISGVNTRGNRTG